MAKSTRSKTKRAFRRVKRESGVFAVADAARMHRLSSKLRAKLATDQEGDVTLPDKFEDPVEGGETHGASQGAPAALEGDTMESDDAASKKISTSGRRPSRRDSWRMSKGKSVQRKNPNKINRLGEVAAKRRAGRPFRRR